MKLHFHGVRGSVPTPGSSTVRYGGNTVCVEVRLADGTLLVLDGGTGLRQLGIDLTEADYRGPITLLLTHLHWDHIMGIPFFAPLYKKETIIRVQPMATEVQRSAVRQRALFDGVHFPVRASDVPATIEFHEDDGEVWQIGSASVRRILLNHPGGAQGFRIDDADGKSLAYITDNELAPPGKLDTSIDDLARFAAGVDMLVHDSQYIAADMPEKHGWGHSTIDEVVALARKAEARHIVPFHHEPTRDDRALDALGAYAKERLADLAIETTVACEGWRVDL